MIQTLTANIILRSDRTNKDGTHTVA